MSFSYSQYRTPFPGFCRPSAFCNPSCGGATFATHSRCRTQNALTRGRDIQADSDWIAVIAFATSPLLKSFLPDALAGCGLRRDSHREQFPRLALRQRHVWRIRLLEHRRHEDRKPPGDRSDRLALRYLRPSCALSPTATAPLARRLTPASARRTSQARVARPSRRQEWAKR